MGASLWMGRMQLSVCAFAMRLIHMGIPTYVSCYRNRRIAPGDLLIGHCAVSNVQLTRRGYMLGST
jgi:6-phospho-3-hexuloisomerase